MVKVSFGITAAIVILAIACGVPYADQAPVYKLEVNGKVILYGTQDSDGFTACNGMKIDKPAGATLVRTAGGCPDDDGAFVPHSGHIPKERPSPKPKPSHT